MKPSQILVLIALTGLCGACSADRHTFRSRVFRPVTVRVQDLVSREFIWSYDVPVYHKLTVNFDRKGDLIPFKAVDRPAEVMKWVLVDERTGKKVANGEQDMPGVPIWLLPQYRSGPETPPDHLPTAAVQPVEVGAVSADDALDSSIDLTAAEEMIPDAVPIRDAEPTPVAELTPVADPMPVAEPMREAELILEGEPMPDAAPVVPSNDDSEPDVEIAVEEVFK